MGVRDGQRLLLPTVHVRPSAAPLIMQIRPHWCLLIRAGRVDPDVVAILTGAGRVAIVAVIITLIGTRPLPIICRKANLVRGAVIGTALLSGHIFETSSGAPACGYVSVAAQAPIAKETSAETATSRVNEVCLGRSTSSSSGMVLYEAMFLAVFFLS